LDLFTGIDQSDLAENPDLFDKLPRAEKIELLIDGETSSVFGGSPWSVGKELDGSVASEIHANKGATLVFAIQADLIDAAESKLRSVRYQLVWDDAVKSEGGTLDVSIIGQTFLVIGVKDEPKGSRLTMWITDDDLKVSFVRQGTFQDLEKIRKEVIGEIGAAADKGDGNPLDFIGDGFNKVAGLVTATQLGGVAILIVLVVGLIIIVRSDAAKELAKNTKAII
jgi:hypothetical protein